MPELPLLLFPEPASSSREKGHGGRDKTHFPSHQRQTERIFPMFNRLQQTFNTRRVELLSASPGIDPEQVIVFETIGRVEDFSKAIVKIEGLEWMGEIDTEEIPADEDFYDEKDADKNLSGRLYLIMSNHRALEEILSLWNRIKDNEDLNFSSGELRGLAKFKEVFKHLKDLRRWGVQDRLHETGIIEIWRENLQYNPDEPVKFEIELWQKDSAQKRTDDLNELRLILSELGGRVLSQCNINEIGYNALLAELPASGISQIIENQNTQLVKSDSVMFFRATGQIIVGEEDVEDDKEEFNVEIYPLPDDPPIAGILDGLPLTNHQLLANRIVIDDPDGWEALYQVSDRKHGTAMASLIINGDLMANEAPINSMLYLRPLMQPNPKSRHRTEFVPDDVLIVDLVHRAVKRMMEGETNQPPVAPTVKVINLSIGDPTRLFDQAISPLAKLIDWLSFKYNVLFIISVGNHAQDINLSISEEEFLALSYSEKEKLVLNELLMDFRNKRLLSPAESINSITVGGLNFDSTDYNLFSSRINPYENVLPSPTNAIGGGFRRSVKPDIVFQSGKQIYNCHFPINGGLLRLSAVSNYSAPGLQVACSGEMGITNKTYFTRGSSNAAALVTRSAIFCAEVLKEILDSRYFENDYTKFEACLIKALIVHGAEWGEIGDVLYSLLDDLRDKKKIKQYISRLIGYGLPNIQKSLECTEQRATVLGFGQLKQEDAHIYEFPLPPSLSSIRQKRRLTVTLSSLSSVAPNNMKYRHSNIWFTLEDEGFVSSRIESDHNAVKRGTLQHEIFEQESAVPFIDGDSIKIKVNCKPDGATDKDTLISYGLVVSLEVAEGIDIAIYNEVRTRIATAIQIQ